MSTAWIILGIIVMVLSAVERKYHPDRVYLSDIGFLKMILCFILSQLNR